VHVDLSRLQGAILAGKTLEPFEIDVVATSGSVPHQLAQIEPGLRGAGRGTQLEPRAREQRVQMPAVDDRPSGLARLHHRLALANEQRQPRLGWMLVVKQRVQNRRAPRVALAERTLFADLAGRHRGQLRAIVPALVECDGLSNAALRDGVACHADAAYE